MNINPISFGKTFKVYAPRHEATKIAAAANGFPCLSTDAQKQIKSLINDTKDGHALVFSYTNPADVCYIFSGKESSEYIHRMFTHTNEIQKAKKDFSLPESIGVILKEKDDFYRKMTDFINKTQEKQIITLTPDGQDIHLIDLKR